MEGGFELINQNGFATIYTYWENESTVFFEIYVQQEGEINNHQVIWENNKQEAIKRIFSESKNAAFYHPIGLVDKQLVFISQAAHLLDLDPDLVNKGIDKDDNPVLLFVSF